MENAKLIAQVIGPFYLMFGLSIFLYLKAWKKIMNDWEKNHYALIPMMTMTFLGGIIMNRMYHDLTVNIWILVTIIGYLAIIKSAFYFLLPGFLIKWKFKLAQNTSVLFLSGLFAIILGGILSYYSYIVV